MPGFLDGRRRRSPRPLARAIAAALLGVAVAAFAGARAPAIATAGTLHTVFDFERPGYGSKDRELTDHFLLESGGTWHLFYTELPGPYSPLCRIGHARSTDLVHWTESATVISAGGADWIATGAWAPHVLVHPSGGWIMFISGRNPFGAQSIGALTSSDLETWTPVAGNPLFLPPAWARNGTTSTNSCRDAFLWFEGGLHQMIYTVTQANGRPAIGRATSPDLLQWTDAGPLLVDTSSSAPDDLESPSLVFDNGRVDLIYTRHYLRMLTGTTSAGPWDISEERTLDPLGGAAEHVRSGATQLLSRVHFDVCEAPTSLVVIDTVTAAPDGFLFTTPSMPPGWESLGSSFDQGWTYGDPPAWRGEAPAQPEGLRWIGSGETYEEPSDPGSSCGAPPIVARTGVLRSPRFTLLGDSLRLRVMGANSPDSAAVRLLDACTGQELARRSGPGSSTLTGHAWSNAGRRGWPVHVELVDLLDRPGGVIGVDDIRDSTAGTFVPPVPVAINQTAPAGGEVLTPGQSYVIRWASFSNAGVDSHVVYVSYDRFATPPIRLQKRNGNQFSWSWTVPTIIAFDVRVRVVAYAKNGVHDCDTSPPFAIGVTTDAPPPDPGFAGEDVVLRVAGSPGATPTLEWSAPAGRGARLDLVDVRGRRVRRLVDERASGGGRGRIAWDGTDDAGRRVPAGLYFAVLALEDGQRRSVRVIRLATP